MNNSNKTKTRITRGRVIHVHDILRSYMLPGGAKCLTIFFDDNLKPKDLY